MQRTLQGKKKTIGKRKPPSSGYTSRNRIELIQAGKDFFDLLKNLIDNAENSIHLQTYIFSEDRTGKFVADALMEASSRGVDVYVLVDGFASQDLSDEFIASMKKAGVRFRYFEPLLKSTHFYFGRRLHHKVVVIDGVRALVGSMNIADRYNDTENERAWFDLALYTEGEAAAELYQICWKLWSKRPRRNFPLPEGSKSFIDSIPAKEQVMVRVRRNDWINAEEKATRTYAELFRTADETITIVCSYFLPGKKLLTLLRRARRRGVRVRVVLAGNTDVITAKYAERWLYRLMLRNGIEVYEYQLTVLHAKTAVADRQWLTLGSYNVNELSAYASVELNLDVKDNHLATELETEIEQVIENNTKAIDLSTYAGNLFTVKQFLQWAAFMLLRIMLKLSTFYFRKKE